MPISNASLLDEDFSAIGDWTNNDEAPATSTQETFDGEETLCQDTNGGAAGNDSAHINRDIGSIEGLGNTIVISFKLYHDAIGTMANTDWCYMAFYRSDWLLEMAFASDGLFIGDGVDLTANEVGADLVQQNVWQEWTFIVDLSGGVESAVCDVYLNNILQASDVDCSYDTGGGTQDGFVQLIQHGWTTDDRITYIDYLKIGDGVLDISNVQINIGDSWKTATGMQINIGDSWKTVTGMQINVGGTWKTIF